MKGHIFNARLREGDGRGSGRGSSRCALLTLARRALPAGSRSRGIIMLVVTFRSKLACASAEMTAVSHPLLLKSELLLGTLLGRRLAWRSASSWRRRPGGPLGTEAGGCPEDWALAAFLSALRGDSAPRGEPLGEPLGGAPLFEGDARPLGEPRSEGRVLGEADR